MNLRFYALILLSFALFSSETKACAFEHAEYVHTADSDWAMSFHPLGKKVLLSDLAVQLKYAESKTSFWFLFDAGSARYINFISTTNVLRENWSPPDPEGGERPLGEMHAFFWNKDMKIIETVPQASSLAPDVIFLPDLSEVLAFRSADRHELRSGMFKLANCER